MNLSWGSVGWSMHYDPWTSCKWKGCSGSLKRGKGTLFIILVIHVQIMGTQFSQSWVNNKTKKCSFCISLKSRITLHNRMNAWVVTMRRGTKSLERWMESWLKRVIADDWPELILLSLSGVKILKKSSTCFKGGGHPYVEEMSRICGHFALKSWNIAHFLPY